jgi:hypothetical protein
MREGLHLILTNHHALRFHTASNYPAEKRLTAFSVVAACSGIDIWDND